MHSRGAPPAPKAPDHSRKYGSTEASLTTADFPCSAQPSPVHPKEAMQHAACLLIVDDWLRGRSACPAATCWLSRACCLLRGGLLEYLQITYAVLSLLSSLEPAAC